MSAPDTNYEKQRKRHRGPIIGITAGLLFVALLTLGVIIWPGVPLDEQAAPDGVPTETSPADAGTGAPPITLDTDADAITEDAQ